MFTYSCLPRTLDRERARAIQERKREEQSGKSLNCHHPWALIDSVPRFFLAFEHKAFLQSLIQWSQRCFDSFSYHVALNTFIGQTRMWSETKTQGFIVKNCCQLLGAKHLSQYEKSKFSSCPKANIILAPRCLFIYSTACPTVSLSYHNISISSLVFYCQPKC